MYFNEDDIKNIVSSTQNQIEIIDRYKMIYEKGTNLIREHKKFLILDKLTDTIIISTTSPQEAKKKMAVIKLEVMGVHKITGEKNAII